LEAVLADAAEQKCTHYVCLGDIVGYNAYPAECLERVRALECPVVKGNHDEQASMLDSGSGFNPLAEEAIQFSRDNLNEVDRAWLRDLRLQRQVRDFTIVHATLDTPHKWGYIFNQLEAAGSFSYQPTRLCFIGHTHHPRAFVRDGMVRNAQLDVLKIESGKKYLVNVGSVGQPRDGNWRAAYCIYDSANEEVELRRVEYDLEGAQQSILKAGLPERLAERLAAGK
jgi:predicted phosphodiesterase